MILKTSLIYVEAVMLVDKFVGVEDESIEFTGLEGKTLIFELG